MLHLTSLFYTALHDFINIMENQNNAFVFETAKNEGENAFIVRFPEE